MASNSPSQLHVRYGFDFALFKVGRPRMGDSHNEIVILDTMSLMSTAR